MSSEFCKSIRGLAMAALGGLILVGVPLAHAQQLPPVPTADIDARVVGQAVVSDFNDLLDANRVLLTIVDTGDEVLGASIGSLNDALRTQLKVPAGQGILVASLRSDGPSAQAGLKAHDILLTLAGKPLATPDDLTKHLKEAGETPVALKLLRAGKEMALEVRPIYQVTLGRVDKQKKEYYLGIQLGGIDEAMRSQLALPKGQGVMISDVVKDSPAEKAGIKPYDIVLEIGGKAVGSPEKLTAQIQAGKDESTTIKLLRAGKPLSMAITASTRTVESSTAGQAVRLRYVRALADYNRPLNLPAQEAKQSQDLRQQIQALRVELERLERELNKAQRPKK